jgi:hypothetical protein
MKKYLIFTILACFIALAGTITFGQHGDLNKIPHGINPNSNSPNWPGFALTTGNTRKATTMRFGGGALINTPTIYIIWYGNWNQNNGSKGDTPAGQALVRQWANDIGNSPYYMLNTSLSVAGKPISGDVNVGAETTDTGKTSLSDTDIQNVVKNAISSGRLSFDPDGVYFVITSSDVTASSGFCTNYCGWHTSTAYSSQGRLRYSFVGNAARCYSACAAQSAKSPNGLPGIDAAISVLTHELEEANTDPDPLSGWADNSGAENADKCAWTFGHAQFTVSSTNPLISGAWANMTINSHNYLIQRNILKTGSSFYCMVNSTQN